jgi:hypothetical protein
MFANFDELHLRVESRRLDKQIDKLMDIQEEFSKLCEEIEYESEAWNLVNKKYWENSAKLKVLFSVQENIDNIIELGNKKATA